MVNSARFPVWLAATVLMCLSPGPNVFTTLSFALARVRAALRSVLGVAAASAVFLAVSALGVIAALAAASTAFFVVRAAGAAYLAYLGVRLLRAALHPTGSPAPVRLTTRPFTQGFMTHISNPKAILYWGALLPQFIEPDRPVAGQVMLLGSLGIVIDVGGARELRRARGICATKARPPGDLARAPRDRRRVLPLDQRVARDRLRGVADRPRARASAAPSRWHQSFAVILSEAKDPTPPANPRQRVVLRPSASG